MTLFHPLVAGAVLGLFACSDGSGSVDGRPTSADARVDAAIDARPPPDAAGPRCSIVQPVDEGLPSHAATVVFDVTVDGLDASDGQPGYGAKGSFADAQGVTVFSRFRSFRVSLEGAVTLGTEYPTNDREATAEIWDAAQGTDSFGAVLHFWDSDYRFCIIDPAGAFGSCRELLVTSFQIPRVAFDGTQYQVVAVTNGWIRRWRFDESGGEIGQDDVWAANPGENGVLEFFAFGEDLVAITADRHLTTPTCGTLRARSTAMPEGRDLLSSEFQTHSGAIAAASGIVVHAVYTGDCLVGGAGPCSSAPGSTERVTFSAAIIDGVIGDPTPIPIARNGASASFGDDSNVMTIYRRTGTFDMHLAGFSPSGALVARHVFLPLALDLPDAYVETVYTGVALGPLDYLIVYEAATVQGPKTRVARVQLTAL